MPIKVVEAFGPLSFSEISELRGLGACVYSHECLQSIESDTTVVTEVAISWLLRGKTAFLDAK